MTSVFTFFRVATPKKHPHFEKGTVLLNVKKCCDTLHGTAMNQG